MEVIEFPTTDKNALRKVFEKYDIRGVFNIAKERGKTLVDEDYVMRRNAVDFGVPLFMEPKVWSYLLYSPSLAIFSRRRPLALIRMTRQTVPVQMSIC